MGNSIATAEGTATVYEEPEEQPEQVRCLVPSRCLLEKGWDSQGCVREYKGHLHRRVAAMLWLMRRNLVI